MNDYNTSRKRLSPVVEAMGKMAFVGNIVPHAWFHHAKMRNGKLTNLTAIHVLSDIVYWYRPAVEVDERTQQTVSVRARFSGHKAYFEYDRWLERLGITKRQLQDAIAFLVKQGLVTHEFHAVWKEADGSRVFNRVFIEPVPAVIAEISDVSQFADHSEESSLTEKREGCPEDGGDDGGSPSSGNPVTEKREGVNEKTRESGTEKRETPPAKMHAIRAEKPSEITHRCTHRPHTDHTPPVASGDVLVVGSQGVGCFQYENDSANALRTGTPTKNTTLASHFSVSESMVETRLSELKDAMLSEGLNDQARINDDLVEHLKVSPPAPQPVASKKLKGVMPSDELNEREIINTAIADSLSVTKNDPVEGIEPRVKSANLVVSGTLSHNAYSVIKTSDLTASLLEIGIKPAKARELLEKFTATAVDHQLDCLPFRDAHDPATVLVRAIEGRWSTPRALTDARKAEEKALEKEVDDARAAMEIEAIQRRKESERAAREAEAEAKKTHEAEVAVALSRLSPAHLNALEQAVWDELSHTPGPVGTSGAAVRDGRKTAQEALVGRLVRVAYDRARSHMVSEWASKGGSLRG